MKKLFTLLLVLLTFSSCQNKESAKPMDFTEGLTGTYPVGGLTVGGKSYNTPINEVQPVVTVTRVSTTSVTLTSPVLINGSWETNDLGECTLRSRAHLPGKLSYDIIKNGVSIGQISEKVLIYTTTYQGTQVMIIAVR